MADAWDYLDEVDVIAKWPSESKKPVLEGGKWSERKDGLEVLNKLIADNCRLSTGTLTIYGELMDVLRKILDRETNIVVVCTAAKTVELLANGLRNKFSGFVGMVFPFLIKRSKDKKKNVRDAVLSALGAVADTTSSEKIQKDIIEWFAIASPESKRTLLEFLHRLFIRMVKIDTQFVKNVAPLVVKCASDSDVEVREKSYMTLGALKMLIGSGLDAFTSPIIGDNKKMEKIGEYEKQAVEEREKYCAEVKPTVDRQETENSGNENESVDNTKGEAEDIDPWTLLDAVDITSKMDNSVESLLIDKNWKQRMEGCEILKKEVNSCGRIIISDRLRELCSILIKIIEKDVNVNVASCSANILAEIAKKARFEFSSIANKSFGVCFEKLKDKKPVLRDSLHEYLDSASTTTPINMYNESVRIGINNKNPQSRGQTMEFLARYVSKNDNTTLDVQSVKELTDDIVKAANDADKTVRESTLKYVAAVSKCIGEQATSKIYSEIFEDNLKAEKIPSLVESLKKECGDSASIEMKRLAKYYGIGAGVSNSGNLPSKKVAPKSAKPIVPAKAVSRPTTSHNRISSATKPIEKNPLPSRPPAASGAPLSIRKTMPSKPIASKPALAKTVPPKTTRPATSRPLPRVASLAQPRPATSGSTRVPPKAPIAPNVVRRSAPTGAQSTNAVNVKKVTPPVSIKPVSSGIKPPVASRIKPPSVRMVKNLQDN